MVQACQAHGEEKGKSKEQHVSHTQRMGGGRLRSATKGGQHIQQVRMKQAGSCNKLDRQA